MNDVVLAKLGTIDRCLGRIRDVTRGDPTRVREIDVQDIAVHDYEVIDVAVLERIVTERLPDLVAFTAAVVSALGSKERTE